MLVCLWLWLWLFLFLEHPRTTTSVTSIRNIVAYAYQDPHLWCTMWPACGPGSNKRPKASRNHWEASENIFGQGALKRGSPIARLGGRWFELVDVAPFPQGACTVHLRYDSWNLCEVIWWAQPREPNKRGGVWEIGLKPPPPTRSCNGSRA